MKVLSLMEYFYECSYSYIDCVWCPFLDCYYPNREMAHSLQHRQAAQFIGLSSACTGKHRSDGPKADNALTFKSDHPMGARHIASTEQGRNLGAVDAIASHLVSLYDQRDWLDFGISTTDQRRSLNVGLSRQKEMYGA